VERDAHHPPPSVILYCQHTPSFNMWSGMHVTLLPLSFCTVNTPPLSTCGAGCTSPSSLCHSVLSTPPLSQPVSHHTRCVRFFLPIPSPIPSDPIPAPHRSVQHGDRSLCTRSLVHLLARTAQVTPVFGATSISAPLLGVFIGGYIIDKLGGYQGAAGLALTLKCCMIFGTVAASMGVCTVPL
jgi:hypothetical protein